ncbi:MAG: flavin-containing monooxygenase [Sandaracinaceae bacterium]
MSAPDVEVAVIGAGLAGLCAGVQLRRAGITDFAIIERRGDVGGTWKVNTYPGVAVDVSSFNYSFSFTRYARWSRAYAPGAEVGRYAEHIATQYGLRSHIRFHTEVEALRWDAEAHLWRVELAGGDTLTARFVIHGPGGLSKPKRPAIEGLESFSGAVMHTAEWDERVGLEGRRVGVIGTGASAVQVVPSIADRVAHLSVFQRTPIWVIPKLDFPIPPAARELLERVPGSYRAIRRMTGLPSALFFRLGTIHHRQLPFLRRTAERIARDHLSRQVRDPATRAALTPRYAFGCKRPALSSDYLRTFDRDDVSLVTDRIARVVPEGVVTEDGRMHALDVLILATGFEVFELGNAPPYPIVGESGRELGAFWHEERYQAYQACTVPGWPNTFLLTAPYGLGGESYLAMVEAAVHHAIRVIGAARRAGATYASVREEAHAAYFDGIQRRLRHGVFQSGACGGSNSYYYSRHGDPVALRPHLGPEMWWRSRFSPLRHYELRTRVAAHRAAADPPARSPRDRADHAVLLS